MIGGSADLAGSNKTTINDADVFQPGSPSGRNLHYGIREHAMGGIMNGMALHGGLRPFGGTFLIFSDYMRPSIRLAGLMGLPVAYVFTHDSIGLGEDGPTHQPIEQLLGLRSIPNVMDLRPCDAAETSYAWEQCLERSDGPAFLSLTRQSVPVLDRTTLAPASGLARGAYVLREAPAGEPDVILIATGSEVSIALEAADVLAGEGHAVRVVSMPSWHLFEAQDPGYREAVLPSNVRARVSVEAGTTLGWERWIGADGVAVGIDHFGASAPSEVLYQMFGVTTERVVDAAHRSLGKAGFNGSNGSREGQGRTNDGSIGGSHRSAADLGGAAAAPA